MDEVKDSKLKLVPQEKTAFMELQIESHYYVVYERQESPGEFTVKKWTFHHDLSNSPTPGPLVGYAKSLDEARGLLPDGLFRMKRDPKDDPLIVETWI